MRAIFVIEVDKFILMYKKTGKLFRISIHYEN